jgi:hypothetical protein
MISWSPNGSNKCRSRTCSDLEFHAEGNKIPLEHLPSYTLLDLSIVFNSYLLRTEMLSSISSTVALRDFSLTRISKLWIRTDWLIKHRTNMRMDHMPLKCNHCSPMIPTIMRLQCIKVHCNFYGLKLLLGEKKEKGRRENYKTSTYFIILLKHLKTCLNSSSRSA